MAHEAILFALAADGWGLGNNNFTTPSFPPVNPGWTNPYSATCVNGWNYYDNPNPDFYENLLGFQLLGWTMNNLDNCALWLVFHTDLWCARLSHCIGESPDNYGVISGITAGAWAQCPVPEWGRFAVESVIQVQIDIKPGNDPNSINPKSKGKIPVAILSTMDFYAPAEVDVESLSFGVTGDEESLAFCNESPEDLNDDGYDDLVCHFYTQEARFECGDEEGILKGQTVNEVPLKGNDSVRIVPSACKHEE